MSEFNLNFGFVSKKPVKEKEFPKYGFPYVEMCVPSEGKGSVSKFKLSESAVELMQYAERDYNGIAYAQDGKNGTDFYLVNTNELSEVPTEHKLNKDFSFNSTTLYNRITKELKLDETKPHFFALVDVSDSMKISDKPCVVVRLDLISEAVTPTATEEVEIPEI